MAEITHILCHMTRGRPHSIWVNSLADVKRGVFERDVPGKRRAGTDVISRSDSWHERMVSCDLLLF